jgi:transposase-like protein
MRFRTKDEIEKHLSAQQSSGLSIAGYCRQESICENTFHNWRKRFPGPASAAPTIPFLKLPFSASTAERLDLTLPNGAKISAPVSFEPESLRMVVRILSPLRPR